MAESARESSETVTPSRDSGWKRAWLAGSPVVVGGLLASTALLWLGRLLADADAGDGFATEFRFARVESDRLSNPAINLGPVERGDSFGVRAVQDHAFDIAGEVEDRAFFLIRSDRLFTDRGNGHNHVLPHEVAGSDEL